MQLGLSPVKIRHLALCEAVRAEQHPCRLSSMAILVDDSAETIPSIYDEAFDLEVNGRSEAVTE
ncbi:hypothetical protein [Lentzea californiensis]|uniref:hypothetical protein n=1 Tax=Lentzea californiensis TaxID=438851 RepID=UPI0021650FAE|nr:hypothetical protein [Lentzea californiensis]